MEPATFEVLKNTYLQNQKSISELKAERERKEQRNKMLALRLLYFGMVSRGKLYKKQCVGRG
jgi:hypothetical protein